MEMILRLVVSIRPTVIAVRDQVLVALHSIPARAQTRLEMILLLKVSQGWDEMANPQIKKWSGRTLESATQAVDVRGSNGTLQTAVSTS